MDLKNLKHLRFIKFHFNSSIPVCVLLFVIVLMIRSLFLPKSFLFSVSKNTEFDFSKTDNSRLKFLEIPQIVWGLNNQKIAFARACLTARMLNRSLLMPSLSASLFYKEIDKLEPISFEKVFKFETFNSQCKGFVQLSRYSDVRNVSNVIELQKGSGRKWIVERDFNQLKQFSSKKYDVFESIRVMGKNPFLWHDHWPVSDYAKVFECLVLVNEISQEADKVVSKIRQFGNGKNEKNEKNRGFLNLSPYAAIHMRIEKDWMIHCKKREQRSNLSDICSSKAEITAKVAKMAKISVIKPETPLYLAVANELLADDLIDSHDSILNGWKNGMHPVDKIRLRVTDVYAKHPYLIQAAIDYEVCLRADVFVGNSYSTFSSLLVLERTQKTMKTGEKWPSYAYNLNAEDGGPRPWMTNLSDKSLYAISYGSNNV